MDPKDVAYDVCRHYICDFQPQLGELYPILNGKLRARDIAFLADAGKLFRPEYHGLVVFRTLRQISAFFKKNADFSDRSVCLQAAKEGFLSSEEACRSTNERLFKAFIEHDHNDPDLNIVLSKAEEFIRSVLGPFDAFISDLPKYVRLTSGASATHSRRHSLPYLKLSKTIECSLGAEPVVRALARYFGYKSLPRIRILGVNRVEFVPKNWKTFRSIACEPKGNLPLQLAVDSFVKERLRRIGINLSDQSRNQQLAYEGSIHGNYATIDLSAASDTVSRSVVQGLFPLDWWSFLNSIRSSHFINFEGKLTKYEKFSSMGNGSTFVIETLIFAAVCHAIGCRKFSVYGDDIVIPNQKFPMAERVLTYLGFTINQEKSYSTGPFRESCGKDYFGGIEVTPFYLRKWSFKPSDLYHNLNGLASVGAIGGSLWSYLSQFIDSRTLLVPFNGISTSGVWIDVHSAYAEGILRTRLPKKKERPFYGYPSYKCLVNKAKLHTCTDSRALFLWFLQKNYFKRKEDSPVDAARVPTLRSVYRREYVCWIPPAQATPVHLYCGWTDYVIRGKKNLAAEA